MKYQVYTGTAKYATIKCYIQYCLSLMSFLVQSVAFLRHETQTTMLFSCKHYVLLIYFNKPVRDHQTCTKISNFIFSDFVLLLIGYI